MYQAPTHCRDYKTVFYYYVVLFSHACLWLVTGINHCLLNSSKACLPLGKRRPTLSPLLLPLGWARLAGFSPCLGQSWVWDLVYWDQGQGWNLGAGEPSSSGWCPHRGRDGQRWVVQGLMSLARKMGWTWEMKEGKDDRREQDKSKICSVRKIADCYTFMFFLLNSSNENVRTTDFKIYTNRNMSQMQKAINSCIGSYKTTYIRKHCNNAKHLYDYG